jgi:hypothetical protein
MTTPTATIASAVLREVLKYGHERLELEFRFGHSGSGAFRPGVSKEAWEAIKAELDSSANFEKQYVETREVIRGSEKTVTNVADGSVTIMHKKRLSDTDIDIAPWTLRASLSLEETDDKPNDRPTAVAPRANKASFTRHKRRWRYLHKCWSVDLTRVQSNLPHQLDTDEDVYEIEIELVDTEELFVRPVNNVIAWGLQMARDFLVFSM